MLQKENYINTLIHTSLKMMDGVGVGFEDASAHLGRDEDTSLMGRVLHFKIVTLKYDEVFSQILTSSALQFCTRTSQLALHQSDKQMFPPEVLIA